MANRDRPKPLPYWDGQPTLLPGDREPYGALENTLTVIGAGVGLVFLGCSGFLAVDFGFNGLSHTATRVWGGVVMIPWAYAAFWLGRLAYRLAKVRDFAILAGLAIGGGIASGFVAMVCGAGLFLGE